MRNLKRALSLALAAVMVLGLMIVGAGAADVYEDFTDKDEIQHKEAVETMVALNVIAGKEDGSFYDPTGTLTRAEMAKIVSYVMNGGVEPVLGTKVTPTYSDIDGHWAEAYIEYCTSMGIIAGDGAGKFNPEGTLTASQTAKMFLTAMGYNANVFELTGGNWEVNTNRYANEAGLYEELGDVNPSQPISRDDAAQMAYNVIQATMMKRTWNQDLATGEVGETYAPWTVESNGQTVGWTLLNEKFDGAIQVGYMTGYTYDEAKAIWTYTFSSDSKFGCAALTANNRIGSSKTLKTDADYTAFYGQQVKVIYNSTVNDKVYGVYANDSQVLADGYSGSLPTSIAAVDETVKFDGTSYKLNAAASSIQVYYNNGGSAVNQLSNLNNAYVPAGAELAAIRLVDNNGDGKVDVVVATPLSELKVTYVGSTTATFEGQGVKKYEDINCYEGIAKDDRVLYTAGTYSSTGIPTYEKLTVETGTVTGIKGTNEVMLDDAWNVNVSGTTLSVGDSVEYVSLGGRLYYAKVVEYGENVNDVVMVITAGKAGSNTSIDGETVEAKLLFSDGSKKTVTLTTIDGSAAVYTNATTGSAATSVGKMFTYKVDNNGKYALTSLAAASQTTGNLAGYDGTGDATGYNDGTVGGKTLADDAVVFVFDGTVGTAATANDGKVYTGKEIKNTFGSSNGNMSASNGPTVTAIGTVASCLYSKDSDGFTYARVAGLVSTDMIVTTGNNYGYLLADAYQNKNADNKNQLNLKFWDGEQEVSATWETETSPDGFKAGAAITYDTVSDSAVKNVSVVLTTDGHVNAYGGGDNLEIDGTPKKVTDDTVILYVDTANTTYSVDGGTIAIGDGVHDNVRYLDGGDGLALLIVDVTNEIEAAPSYITDKTNADGALAKTQNVTISGSISLSELAALTHLTSGKSLTITGDVTTADSVFTLAEGASLIINGTLHLDDDKTFTVNGTLTVGMVDDTNVGQLALGAAGHIIYKGTPTTAVMTEFETWTSTGSKITLSTSATGAANKWYSDPGHDNVNGANTGAAGVAGTSVAAGTYVYGTVYTDNNGTTGNGWVLQK